MSLLRERTQQEVATLGSIETVILPTPTELCHFSRTQHKKHNSCHVFHFNNWVQMPTVASQDHLSNLQEAFPCIWLKLEHVAAGKQLCTEHLRPDVGMGGLAFPLRVQALAHPHLLKFLFADVHRATATRIQTFAHMYVSRL